jgi:hypothetical protein
MHRFFSMFPDGLPGTGLLLLRFYLVGVLLLVSAKLYCTGENHFLFAVVLVIAVALLIGIVTPMACLAALGIQAAALFTGQSHSWSEFLELLVPAILFLLGPGAYAVDCQFFGRQVVTLPARLKLSKARYDQPNMNKLDSNS